MKKLIGALACVTAGVVLTSGVAQAQTFYNNEAAFLNALQGTGYFRDNLNDISVSGLAEAKVVPLTRSGNSHSYVITEPTSLYSNPSGSGPDVQALYTITDISSPANFFLTTLTGEDHITLLPGGAWAVGGNFFVTDQAGNYLRDGNNNLLPTPVTIAIDTTGGPLGGTFNLLPTDFFGYILPAGDQVRSWDISTSMQLPDGIGGTYTGFASFDNLTVVPEPSVVLTNLTVLLGAAGAGLAYRRRLARKA